jgi:ATP-binding cassette, subfamily C, type I secretion system permease/ATPase
VIAGFLYGFQAVLDIPRSRILVRVGRSLDVSLSARVFDALVRLPLFKQVKSESPQSLRDLDQLRTFISGPGPSAMFDVPWMPLYLFICFLFHFWIGIAATIGGIVLLGMTLLIEFRSRRSIASVNAHSATRSLLAERSRRNAEVLEAMGMGQRAGEIWQRSNSKFLNEHQRLSDISGGLGAISRVFRALLQSGILAIGAYLVINHEAPGGVIIASSILTARALQPLDSLIGQWKSFTSARESWTRLSELLTEIPAA